MPGGILVATLITAWRWPGLGGTLFLLEKLAVAAGFPILVSGRKPVSTGVMRLLTLAAPLVAAGVTLLWSAQRGAPVGPPGTSPL